MAAFKEASARLATLMPLTAEKVETLAAAFESERKTKARRRGKG